MSLEADDPLAATLEAHRTSLRLHAYRLLGDRSEAEDVVHDAYLRWSSATAHTHVESDAAFLRTTVTRLCLDRLRSARARREVYVGPWLPEPLVARDDDDPATALAFADDVSFALLLVLERLTPLERAAFLLHDVMGIPFAEVARTLDRSELATRRLASRARDDVRTVRRRAIAAPELRDRLAAAIAGGDVDTLRSLLAPGVVYLADSGGAAPAALNPIRGADRVARLLLGLAKKFGAGLRHEPVTVNGMTGWVVRRSTGIDQTLTFEANAERRIVAFYATRNPAKLIRVEAPPDRLT